MRAHVDPGGAAQPEFCPEPDSIGVLSLEAVRALPSRALLPRIAHLRCFGFRASSLRAGESRPVAEPGELVGDELGATVLPSGAMEMLERRAASGIWAEATRLGRQHEAVHLVSVLGGAKVGPGVLYCYSRSAFLRGSISALLEALGPIPAELAIGDSPELCRRCAGRFVSGSVPEAWEDWQAVRNLPEELRAPARHLLPFIVLLQLRLPGIRRRIAKLPEKWFRACPAEPAELQELVAGVGKYLLFPALASFSSSEGVGRHFGRAPRVLFELQDTKLIAPIREWSWHPDDREGLLIRPALLRIERVEDGRGEIYRRVVLKDVTEEAVQGFFQGRVERLVELQSGLPAEAEARERCLFGVVGRGRKERERWWVDPDSGPEEVESPRAG